jgi:hypothetical protein
LNFQNHLNFLKYPSDRGGLIQDFSPAAIEKTALQLPDRILGSRVIQADAPRAETREGALRRSLPPMGQPFDRPRRTNAGSRVPGRDH